MYFLVTKARGRAELELLGFLLLLGTSRYSVSWLISRCGYGSLFGLALRFMSGGFCFLRMRSDSNAAFTSTSSFASSDSVRRVLRCRALWFLSVAAAAFLLSPLPFLLLISDSMTCLLSRGHVLFHVLVWNI